MDSQSFLSLLPLLLVLIIIGVIWANSRRSDRAAADTGTTHTYAPTPEYKGPTAFFRRHFNGDYPLARSYWVNTFLISLFAPAVGIMLLPWLAEGFPARFSSAGFLFVTALGVAAWTWAVAGTWASANKHVQRGGTSGWANAAKFMIVIGLLRTVGEVGSMMPTIQEHVPIALGKQLGPQTKLEVRADGRSILLSGGINDGSSKQLESALQVAPSVSTVVLSSDGGWIREGQMLANVIRSRHLNTYVEGHCASACTIAFLAGKERAADPSAKIGFHASRSVGSTGTTPNTEETRHLQAIYHGAGLPESFVRQVIDTPTDTMWYPTHDVLLASGVLTRKSFGGETAAIATNLRTKDALIAEFKKLELFELLSNRSPEDFDRMMQAAWERVQKGATDAEVTTSARTQLSSILQKFLPLASDETLIAYQALMLEQLESLRDIDPSACVEAAYPSGKQMQVMSLLPADLSNREIRLTTQALREANASNAIKPTEGEQEQFIQLAVKDMTPEQLQVFSNESLRKRTPQLETCGAAIKFFAGLNAIPRAQRARALRILYSGS